MTTATLPTTRTHPRRLVRSTAAVFVGFISVAVLSLGTDQVLHVFEVYPPWGEPMYDPRLNLLDCCDPHGRSRPGLVPDRAHRLSLRVAWWRTLQRQAPGTMNGALP